MKKYVIENAKVVYNNVYIYIYMEYLQNIRLFNWIVNFKLNFTLSGSQNYMR